VRSAIIDSEALACGEDGRADSDKLHGMGVDHAVVLCVLQRAPGRRWRELIFRRACRIGLKASSPKAW
jgi:hypothetical protein